MARRFRSRLPSHTTVVAYLALALALTGGVAWAAALKKNSVTSKQIAPNAVKGSDVDESSLGQVPKAKQANTASSANTAQNASTAQNAGAVDGVDSTSFARNDQIGAFTSAALPDVLGSCTVPIGDSWGDLSPNVNVSASYRRDQLGVVHLSGTTVRCNAAGDTIFTLPAGLRPPALQHFGAAADNETSGTAQVNVGSDGQVFAPASQQNDVRSLDGISFRCGPSGVSGCP